MVSYLSDKGGVLLVLEILREDQVLEARQVMDNKAIALLGPADNMIEV